MAQEAYVGPIGLEQIEFKPSPTEEIVQELLFQESGQFYAACKQENSKDHQGQVSIIILGDQNMRMKALSPNNMIGRHLTTQNRVAPPKFLRRIRDITKMKATHNAKDERQSHSS
jgi:hypothetical protein